MIKAVKKDKEVLEGQVETLQQERVRYLDTAHPIFANFVGPPRFCFRDH